MIKSNTESDRIPDCGPINASGERILFSYLSTNKHFFSNSGVRSDHSPESDSISSVYKISVKSDRIQWDPIVGMALLHSKRKGILLLSETLLGFSIVTKYLFF